MNKTIASISAAVVVGGSSLSAFVPAAADLGVTSDLTYATEYVFRGVELADNSFQPSLEASAGDFYVGLFANLPTSNGHQEPGNDRGSSEIHYYAGFALEIPGLEGVVFDVGATVYHRPDAGVNRTHEGFIGTKFEDLGIAGLGAAVYYFYDSDRRTNVVEGSVGYSFALDQAGDYSLDLSGVYGNQFGSSIRGDQANRINENYHYYGASAELPYRLNEFSTLTAGAHYQTAERADLQGRLADDNIFWTISYTAGF